MGLGPTVWVKTGRSPAAQGALGLVPTVGTVHEIIEVVVWGWCVVIVAVVVVVRKAAEREAVR